MLDVDNLPADVIGALYNRLEGTPEGRRDAIIAQYSPRRVAREYAAWHLGDYAWADDILDAYKAAELAAVSEPQRIVPTLLAHNHTNDLFQPNNCSGCKRLLEWKGETA